MDITNYTKEQLVEGAILSAALKNIGFEISYNDAVRAGIERADIIEARSEESDANTLIKLLINSNYGKYADTDSVDTREPVHTLEDGTPLYLFREAKEGEIVYCESHYPFANIISYKATHTKGRM